MYEFTIITFFVFGLKIRKRVRFEASEIRGKEHTALKTGFAMMAEVRKEGSWKRWFVYVFSCMREGILLL